MSAIYDNDAPPMEARGILTQFGTNVIHENLDFRVEKVKLSGLSAGLVPVSPSC